MSDLEWGLFKISMETLDTQMIKTFEKKYISESEMQSRVRNMNSKLEACKIDSMKNWVYYYA